MIPVKTDHRGEWSFENVVARMACCSPMLMINELKTYPYMLQIGALFGSHRKSCDRKSHDQKSCDWKSQDLNSCEGSHVTGSNMTRSRMTRSRMTGSDVLTFDDIINFCAHKVMTSSISVHIGEPGA